jgi:hypothetical protein
VKYGGKIACCRVENWARGRAEKARGPARKVWKRLEPRSVPYWERVSNAVFECECLGEFVRSGYGRLWDL